MDLAASQDERTLLAQLRLSRARLDGLERDLAAVESELEGLSTERRHYGLVGTACGALETLGQQGAAGLFWGEGVAADLREACLRQARSRVDRFEKRLAEVEERQQAALDEMARERANHEWLEDDLYEARRLEEERKHEWVVEREVDPWPDRPSIMPWARGGEDDRRFRKSLAVSLGVSLLLGVLLPQIELPILEREEVIEVPERLVRLIQRERPRPLPPAKPAVAQTRPDPKRAEPVERPAPRQAPQPSAESKGILAFREKFSGLSEARAPSRLGAEARIRSGGDAASGSRQRSMVATRATGSSGGIDLGTLSRDVGGGGSSPMAGVQVTRSTSSIGGVPGQDRPRADGPAAGRTDEEIQIVFDRHKAALYRLYNRELRRDPTLKGQMVLRLRIEPDGSVSMCALQSSDMEAPQLAAQVVERVRTFDFGAKEVPPVTILYPIDFLPAT